MSCIYNQGGLLAAYFMGQYCHLLVYTHLDVELLRSTVDEQLLRIY